MLEDILDAVRDPTLQELLKFGYVTQEYEVMGHLVTLGTLRASDRQSIALKLNGLDLLARHAIEQTETLALSIKSIDGVDYADGANRVQLRVFLNNASDPILNYLWDCYLKLISVQRVTTDALLQDVKKKLVNPLSTEQSGKSLEHSDSEIPQTSPG